MASRCPGTGPLFLPFLYPTGYCFRHASRRGQRVTAAAWPGSSRPLRRYATGTTAGQGDDTAASVDSSSPEIPKYPISRLNPAPDDYAAASFADKALLTVHAGTGGNGCISFLRELFLPDGPPNGGDGGHGGNVYIQAVPGETSLHKIARRRVMRAGRGKHGQGSARNGQRGDDMIITVPVGTVVTEVSRIDPVVDEADEARERAIAWNRRRKQARAAAEEAKQARIARAKAAREEEAARIAREDAIEAGEEIPEEEERLDHAAQLDKQLAEMPPPPLTPEERARQEQRKLEEEEEDAAETAWLRKNWVVYPGLSATEVKTLEFPRLPRRDRVYMQPPSPIYLDLSRPTPQPILLAAGGIGGLGNPSFVSRDMPRPVVATKGQDSVTMTIHLELRLLADVGLVGLPNAGKSTLLRAISNSRTRVGNWAFTTLHPNIGTVVLDNNRGRPVVAPKKTDDEDDTPARTRFTVADIPGLIEGAHLDKGLGIAFLRHVERAGVLAFVIDLGAGDAVAALKALWKEVGLYARFREEEEQQRGREARIEREQATPETNRFTAGNHAFNEFAPYSKASLSVPSITPEMAIAGKPWYVVATKGDLPGAEANFQKLKTYLAAVECGSEGHPSGLEDAWTDKLAAIPVSAINGHGVDSIVHWTVGLLDQ